MSDESLEMTDTDEADLVQLFSEPDGEQKPMTFHPILRVWQEVLAPAADELQVKPTPQWSNRIINQYPAVTYADMYQFRDLYYGRIMEFAKILADEIATDDECLTYTTPEEDVENNSHHYKNLLVDWQLALLQWELEWDCLHADAGVDLAAISEIHKMFFDQNGITAYLDNIKFEFTDADRHDLAGALEKLRDGGES